ncbi:hypothetical protein RRG08_027064 [Elysia crispata]|uniref:Uncharacterized protein n=1 Tax=Elysia crispata TaxID=231223 RepID=A0AAE0ZHV0_9GAST|nr:hypothetical protein RRG08_027064 [Elysia crispata]
MSTHPFQENKITVVGVLVTSQNMKNVLPFDTLRHVMHSWYSPIKLILAVGSANDIDYKNNEIAEKE